MQPTTTQLKQVNVLLRVSSKQQLHADDIPIQRAECQRFISQHTDWEFQHEYLEKAISGFKNTSKERDILMEIAQDAKDKKFDILLVYMSDRLGRREDDTPFYVSQLNSLGIEVWSVNEGQLKTEQHVDKLINYIRFWQANGESLKTSQRVKDAQIEMVKQGRHVGGYAPFGYELVYSGDISNHGRALKKLIIKESEATIVRKIFDLAYYNEYGAFKIAKALNTEGIHAIKSSEWKAPTIGDILKNPIYMGYITYNRRTHKNGYEKLDKSEWVYSEKPREDLIIIPQKIWEGVQEKRELRKSRISSQKESNGGSYPISTSGQLSLMGIAYCGYCGTKLTNGSRYDYWTLKDGTKVSKMCGRYRCTQKASGSLKCEGTALYRADQLEPIVYEAVRVYLSKLKDENLCKEILNSQEKQRKQYSLSLKQLEKEIKTIQLDITTMESQIPAAVRGETILPLDKIYSIIQEKEKVKTSLEQELNEKQKEYSQMKITTEDLSDLAFLTINWDQRFIQSTVALKRVILSKLIEQIRVRKGRIDIDFKIRVEDFLPLISNSPEVQKQRL